MLHMIKESPNRTSTLRQCLTYTAPGDLLLFISDGVNICLNWDEWETIFNEKSVRCYCLTEDLKARGLLEYSAHIPQISYEGWVTLTEEHPSNITW